MLVSPYDTTICRHYKVDQIKSDLIKSEILNPFAKIQTPVGNTVRDAFVVTPNSVHDHISGFTQPVNIGTSEKSKWIIDGRSYMRWDRRNDTYRLVGENDYSFQCVRLALIQALQEHGQHVFFRLGDVPAKTFVRWITLALGQRFNLDLEHQIRVSVIAAYYYYTQLSEHLRLTPEEVQMRAPMVSRITSVPASDAMEIGMELGPLSNAEHLAAAIASHSGTVRLNELKFADLYTIIAGSWIGVNARENVGVALEHIPTWIALVYAALDERSYRKTVLSQRAQTAGRQADLKQFTDAVFRLVSVRFD